MVSTHKRIDNCVGWPVGGEKCAEEHIRGSVWCRSCKQRRDDSGLNKRGFEGFSETCLVTDGRDVCGKPQEMGIKREKMRSGACSAHHQRSYVKGSFEAVQMFKTGGPRKRTKKPLSLSEAVSDLNSTPQPQSVEEETGLTPSNEIKAGTVVKRLVESAQKWQKLQGKKHQFQGINVDHLRSNPELFTQTCEYVSKETAAREQVVKAFLDLTDDLEVLELALQEFEDVDELGERLTKMAMNLRV